MGAEERRSVSILADLGIAEEGKCSSDSDEEGDDDRRPSRGLGHDDVVKKAKTAAYDCGGSDVASEEEDNFDIVEVGPVEPYDEDDEEVDVYNNVSIIKPL
jgi:hypothetical protein